MFGSRGKVNKSSSVSIRQEHCLKSYWQDGNITSQHQVPVCVYRSSMKHINILPKFDGNEPPPVESDGTLAAQMHLLRPCGQGVKDSDTDYVLYAQQAGQATVHKTAVYYAGIFGPHPGQAALASSPRRGLSRPSSRQYCSTLSVLEFTQC